MSPETVTFVPSINKSGLEKKHPVLGFCFCLGFGFFMCVVSVWGSGFCVVVFGVCLGVKDLMGS